MKRDFFYFLIIFAIAMSSIYAQKHTITVEELYSLERVSEFSVSPDGKWVLYKASKPNISSNKSVSHIFIISADGKEKIQLTKENDPVSSPVWSPKSNKIAYIQSKDGTNYIYTLDIPSGVPNKIATFKEDI